MENIKFKLWMHAIYDSVVILTTVVESM